MDKQNIALIGMMGTFKTSAGLHLAQKLNFEFVDTDELLTLEFSKSVFELLNNNEAEFRVRERDVVKKAARLKGAIISCGGGVALYSENVEILKKTCYIVLLTASPQAILSRVSKNDDRPLLRGENKLEKILALNKERQALYLAAADMVIDDTNLTSIQTAQEIFRELALKS